MLKLIYNKIKNMFSPVRCDHSSPICVDDTTVQDFYVALDIAHETTPEPLEEKKSTRRIKLLTIPSSKIKLDPSRTIK